MSDLVGIFLIFAVPPLIGGALAFWRHGFLLVALLAGLALVAGLFFQMQEPPAGSDPLARAVLINVLFIFSSALLASWLVTTLVRVWLKRRT